MCNRTEGRRELISGKSAHYKGGERKTSYGGGSVAWCRAGKGKHWTELLGTDPLCSRLDPVSKETGSFPWAPSEQGARNFSLSRSGKICHSH